MPKTLNVSAVSPQKIMSWLKLKILTCDYKLCTDEKVVLKILLVCGHNEF